MDQWFMSKEERQAQWRATHEKRNALPTSIEEARQKIEKEIKDAHESAGYGVFSSDGAERLTRFIEAMIDLKVAEALRLR
jgi:hypothetical protein